MLNTNQERRDFILYTISLGRKQETTSDYMQCDLPQIPSEVNKLLKMGLVQWYLSPVLLLVLYE